MPSLSRTRPAVHPARVRQGSRSRSGRLLLTEKQTQAYLAARDVLRRIVRTNTLVMPPHRPIGGEGSDRTEQ